MDEIIKIIMHDQPDHTTCGPTSLHSVYSFYGDKISLSQIIDEIQQFDEGGGTLAVVLGSHALKRGYDVQLYSYNVTIFDPTWFNLPSTELIKNLKLRQARPNIPPKEHMAIGEYILFLENGGRLRFEDLSRELLARYLRAKVPILTGLSSTWLYRIQRENSVTNIDDPICGDPAGHFVVISGLKNSNTAMVADPYKLNPISEHNYYEIGLDRLTNAILLGVTTFDGNLLIIRKKT